MAAIKTRDPTSAVCPLDAPDREHGPTRRGGQGSCISSRWRSGRRSFTSEPLRVDDVIEVWADRPHDPTDTGSTLREMWRFSEAEQVLALPVPLLRALSNDYIATLPADVQAKVRARRAAGS